MADAVEAADELEKLSVEIAETILYLRSGNCGKSWAYWKVYYMRAKMNRIVASLGAGIPPGKQVYHVDRGEL